jgi:multiple antibiotic resistance protein
MPNPPLSYIFTIFFLTLGPVKTIPAFFGLTREANAAFRKKTALQAALISTGICLFIGFIGRNVLANWGVSLDALKLAGGLILLLSALKVVTMQPQPTGGQKVTTDTPLSATLKLAIAPLSTPVIVTPYGVVAILFYMAIAKGNAGLQGQILGIMLSIMLLNYLGMIFADKIMQVVGMAVLRLIGWIFAVMQSALAIDIMLRAFKSLGVIKSIP